MAHRRRHHSELKCDVKGKITNFNEQSVPVPVLKEELRKNLASPNAELRTTTDNHITVASTYGDCPKDRHHHLYNHKYLQFL